MGNYNVTIEIGNDNAPIQPRRYMQLQIEVLDCKVTSFQPGE